MRRPLLLIIPGILVVSIAAVVIFVLFNQQPPKVSTYQQCVNAGYPVQETYPTTCVTPNGKTFSGPLSTPTTQSVAVYFSEGPQSNQEFSFTKAVLRVTDRIYVETFVIEELIKGPLDSEVNDGLFSSLQNKLTGESSCGGKDFQLTNTSGIATLQFCRTINSAGIGDDGRILATIRDSLRQFNTITSLSILDQNGNCLGDLSGANRCA